MLDKLRQRSGEESGFTLVELLVVMLILGILAAIAIPSFFNQRDKAGDAEAKSMARTAQTAMETYATDNNGLYTGATETELVTIEQTLSNAPSLDAAGAGKGYTLSVVADGTGTTFSIARNATTGVVSYGCNSPNEGGCPSTSNWG